MPRAFILLIIAAGVAVCSEIARRWRLAPMFNRPCAGRDWRRAFPGAANAEIREFLRIFVDAFAINRKRFLAFRPDDRIMDVYHAMYALKGEPDCMELETFAQLIEKRYGGSILSHWRDDLTLGEVFSRTGSG